MTEQSPELEVRLTNDEKEAARSWLYDHNGGVGGGLGGLWDMVELIVAERVALALSEAKDDIKARIVTFRNLNADPQYLNALNDAWGLVANRKRSYSPEGGDRG